MLHRIPLAIAVASVVCGVGTWEARAQPVCTTDSRAEAVRLAREAREAMGERRYDDALAGLKRAHALCPLPEFLHALGRVQEAAGAHAEAARSYRACEREATEDTLRQECRSRADALEARPEKPIPAPGVATSKPEPAPTPAPATQPAPEPPPREPTTRKAVSRDTTWNWVGIGASVALIGAGVGFLAKYGKDRADARGAEYYPDGTLAREADTVRPINAVVGGVCAGLGVAGLVTSLLLWPDHDATATVTPTTAGAGLTVSVRW